MRARGTSLGADNGIGLSMALAVLEDDSITHGPLEVITTTNEEDGMTGAANLAADFIRGRKVINLDSEDYDTITTGAAGACLQLHRIPMKRESVPTGKHRWYRISISGGLGGHSGVDINKGRCSAVIPLWALLTTVYNEYDFQVASISIGEANASIASSAEITISLSSSDAEFIKKQEQTMNKWLDNQFGDSDPGMHCTISPTNRQDTVISHKTIETLLNSLKHIPQGVVKMSDTMKGTVETSNNIGRIQTEKNHISVSTHTRSFIDSEMEKLSHDIANAFASCNAKSETVMSAPAWQEDQKSAFLQQTSDTFQEVLGWRPRMVAMHFVLEAGFFVQHYPGIQIASIGPRIVEPHSTNERVELSTIEDIWRVLLELLKNLA